MTRALLLIAAGIAAAVVLVYVIEYLQRGTIWTYEFDLKRMMT